jgi:hypothetical protein
MVFSGGERLHRREPQLSQAPARAGHLCCHAQCPLFPESDRTAEHLGRAGKRPERPPRIGFGRIEGDLVPKILSRPNMLASAIGYLRRSVMSFVSFGELAADDGASISATGHFRPDNEGGCGGVGQIGR